MAGESCNIFARKRNRETGQLTTSSTLHKKLLGLGKAISNYNFNRKRANKALFLSQSPSFLKKYDGQLIFDSDMADSEVTLISLWETLQGSEMKDVTVEDMRNYLSKENGEGIYTQEEAYQKVIDFNKSMKGANTFMGTMELTTEGKYKFRVAVNTVQEQEKLIKTIADINIKNRITQILNQLGVGVVEDNKSYYNTINPETLSNGLLGVIHLRKGINEIKDFSYEVGHFVIGALGRDNKLVQRLTKVVSTNRDVVRDLLGDEEYLPYADTENESDELLGHIIGKTIQDWDKLEAKGIIGNIKHLVNRILDYIKARLANTNERQYQLDMYEAKYAAYDVVKNLMKHNFKGSLATALTNKQRLEGDIDPLLKILTSVASQMDITFNEVKDKSDSVFKNYRAATGNSLDAILKFKAQSSQLSDVVNQREREELKEQMVKELLREISFIKNELITAQGLLNLAVRGVKKFNNEPVTLKEQAEYIKYNESILKLATAFTGYQQQITDELLNIGVSADLVKDINRLFEQISVTTGHATIRDTKTGEPKKVRYDLAILNAQRKMALQLLIDCNGSQFIAIDQYVHFKDWHTGIMREYNPELVDLSKEIIATQINPPISYINRWIDGLAESPDIINQLVYQIVEQQKQQANTKTLELKDRLAYLYTKLRETKVSDTDVFFERDADNNYTGNLISERNWGKWEAAYRKEKHDFDEWFFKNNNYSSLSAMYNSFAYISQWEKHRKHFHTKNSIEQVVYKADGTPEIDEITGKKRTIWVPAISTDPKVGGKNFYDSEQYNEVKTKYGEKAIEWLDEYLKLKKELDALIPRGGTNRLGLRAPQFTTHIAGRLKNSIVLGDGALSKVKNTGISLRNFCSYAVSQSPDDTEFGDDTDTYYDDDMDSDIGKVFSRAHSNAINSIKRVPVYGVRKLKNMNELSTDLIHSTLAYGAMSYSYDSLNEVVDQVQELKHVLYNRGVNNDYTVAQRDTVDAPTSYVRLEDYIDMQVFGLYTDSNKTFQNRVLRKTMNLLSQFGSYYFLGFNYASSFVNAFTGLKAIMKESFSNEEIYFKDFVWATGIYAAYWAKSFGENVCNIFMKKGSMVESANKMDLFFRMFDVGSKNAQEFREYHVMSKGYGITKGYSPMNAAMLTYNVTDDWMQGVPFLLAAKATKLRNKTTGELVNIWDAYEVREDTETKRNKLVLKGNPEDWEIKDVNLERVQDRLLKEEKEAKRKGQFLTDDKMDALYNKEVENGITKHTSLKSTYVPWDAKSQSAFKVRVRAINNRMHGVYNSSDGGSFMKIAIATPILALKKYAIGLIDGEFSRARYDHRTKQMRQGTMVTALNLLLDQAVFINQKGARGTSLFEVSERKLNIWANRKYKGQIPAQVLINAAKLLLGITKFAWIIATGGLTHYGYLRRRGYSRNQIANLRRQFFRMLFYEISRTLLHLCAPPDKEEETSTLISNGINSMLDLVGSSTKLEDLTEGEWFPEVSQLFTKGYLGILNLISKVTPLTENDESYLTEEELERAIYKTHDSIPFSIKGIIYYHVYRAIVEEISYDALSPKDLLTEGKSVFLTAFPACFSALLDFSSITRELLNSKTYDELLEKYEKNNKVFESYAEMDDDEYKRIYQKGSKEGYLKGIRRFLGTGFSPIRSGFTYLDGYSAVESLEYYRNTAISDRRSSEDD